MDHVALAQQSLLRVQDILTNLDLQYTDDTDQMDHVMWTIRTRLIVNPSGWLNAALAHLGCATDLVQYRQRLADVLPAARHCLEHQVRTLRGVRGMAGLQSNLLQSILASTQGSLLTMTLWLECKRISVQTTALMDTIASCP